MLLWKETLFRHDIFFFLLPQDETVCFMSVVTNTAEKSFSKKLIDNLFASFYFVHAAPKKKLSGVWQPTFASMFFNLPLIFSVIFILFPALERNILTCVSTFKTVLQQKRSFSVRDIELHLCAVVKKKWWKIKSQRISWSSWGFFVNNNYFPQDAAFKRPKVRFHESILSNPILPNHFLSHLKWISKEIKKIIQLKRQIDDEGKNCFICTKQKTLPRLKRDTETAV